jgi:hypothetical protein
MFQLSCNLRNFMGIPLLFGYPPFFHSFKGFHGPKTQWSIMS